MFGLTSYTQSLLVLTDKQHLCRSQCYMPCSTARACPLAALVAQMLVGARGLAGLLPSSAAVAGGIAAQQVASPSICACQPCPFAATAKNAVCRIHSNRSCRDTPWQSSTACKPCTATCSLPARLNSPACTGCSSLCSNCRRKQLPGLLKLSSSSNNRGSRANHKQCSLERSTTMTCRICFTLMSSCCH